MGKVGPGTSPVIRGTQLLDSCWAKMEGARVHFGTPGNRESHQNRTFEHRSALGPSKNGLREGSGKKHEKSMENGPERVRFFEENNMLKRNKHGAGAKFRGFPFFRKKSKNRCQRGSENQWKLDQNATWGPPWSTYPPLWSILGDVEKSMIFGVAPGGSKINKNRSLERSWLARRTSTVALRRRRIPYSRKRKNMKTGKTGDSTRLEGRWPGEFKKSFFFFYIFVVGHTF